MHRPHDGVLAHPQDGRQVDGQREPIAGAGLTLGDGPADLRRHPVVEGDRLGTVPGFIGGGAFSPDGRRPAAFALTLAIRESYSVVAVNP